MPHFQTGEVPHGFAFTETGGLIHYKHTILLAVPRANQTGTWGDLWLLFGSAWGDVKLGVSVFSGTAWGGVQPWDVKDNGPRTGKKLPAGAEKIAIGRWKQSAGDRVDDNPVSWVLEYL
jgi:hypothetical protein